MTTFFGPVTAEFRAGPGLSLSSGCRPSPSKCDCSVL